MSLDILIVDDNERLRTSLCHWLKSVFPSCDIEEARSGQEAIDSALIHPSGIILMDVAMPGMNGIEATRRIKALCTGGKGGDVDDLRRCSISG